MERSKTEVMITLLLVSSWHLAMINIRNMIDTQVRLCWRKDEIPHNDRSKKGLIIEFSFCQQYSTKFKLLFLKPLCEGVDARHILPQREERPLPQHLGQQRLHQVHLLNKGGVRIIKMEI